ncbi:MAG: hypothetical protein FWF41_04745 [Betaproteobacteria bacterium]|nr:hypothetical protein [Betaproteobacteria bacterium]
MKFSDIKETLMGKGIIAVGLVALLALAGCATTSSPEASSGAAQALTPEQQAEIVKKRAQERWDAMIAKDYAKAYTYLSPATRKLGTEEQFAAYFAQSQFKKVEVQEAKCEDNACTVKFFLTYDYKNFKDVKTPAGEKWLFQDGQAWFSPSEK